MSVPRSGLAGDLRRSRGLPPHAHLEEPRARGVDRAPRHDPRADRAGPRGAARQRLPAGQRHRGPERGRGLAPPRRASQAHRGRLGRLPLQPLPLAGPIAPRVRRGRGVVRRIGARVRRALRRRHRRRDGGGRPLAGIAAERRAPRREARGGPRERGRRALHPGRLPSGGRGAGRAPASSART